MSMSAYAICVPKKARGGHQFPKTWSWRELWAARSQIKAGDGPLITSHQQKDKSITRGYPSRCFAPSHHQSEAWMWAIPQSRLLGHGFKPM